MGLRWDAVWTRAELISGPFARMESASLADSESGRELRALNPFTGVLTQKERLAVIRGFANGGCWDVRRMM